MLNEDVKNKIDTTNFSEEYRTAIEMKSNYWRYTS